MRKLFLVVSLLLASMTAFADEAFMAACKEASAGGPGGDGMCGCFAEGLSKGAKADELLAIVKAPREGRREVVQGTSDGTRQVMRGCMQGMRPGGGEGRPRGE